MDMRFTRILLAGMFLMPAAVCEAGYPKFNIGASGIWADIPNGSNKVVVVETAAGTPAYGKFEKGDVIKAVNGTEIKGKLGDYVEASDPRRILGDALGKAEATNGKLVFSVERASAVTDVEIVIPVMGAYSKTWPLDCKKSDLIIKQAGNFLQSIQRENGTFNFTNSPGGTPESIAQCLAGIFLLSTDDASCIAAATRSVHCTAKGIVENGVTGSTWQKGYLGIVLAEHYLKTGDKSVLPALTKVCEAAAKTQVAGGWGHSSKTDPGYSLGGLLNEAGIPVFASLILARECGVAVDEDTFLRSLKFFSRFAGHGGSAYGDQRGDGQWGCSNGKDAMTACAFSLLPGDDYRAITDVMSLVNVDTYEKLQSGHAGGGFNVIWRGIGIVHLPKKFYSHARRQADETTWFYDLARLPGGGFEMPASPPNGGNYSGIGWGSGIGLTYTAPKRTLRITGCSPSKYGVKKSVPEYNWGGVKKSVFLRTDFCEGGDDMGMAPHAITKKLSCFFGVSKENPSVDLCAKMMRHYTDHVRTWAANNLNANASEEAYIEIEKALKHKDARVRRAGMDAISCYFGSWFGVGSTRNKIPKEVVTKRFLPYLVKALENPKADWWEIDGALWAMSRAGTEAVKKELPVIKKYAMHEEWWLRQSACYAIGEGLGSDIDSDTMQFLAERFAAEGHEHLRDNLRGIFQRLTKDNKAGKGVRFDEAAQKKLAKTLVGPFTKTYWAEGYVRNADVSESDPTSVLDLMRNFHSDDLVYIIDDVIKLIDSWEKQEFFDNAQIDLCGQVVHRCMELGEKGRPLMERIAKVYTGKRSMRRGMPKVAAGIKAYEKKYGVLKNSTEVAPENKAYTSSLKKGLIGYWQFDEGTGEESTDASGKNNKAMLKGGAEWSDGLIGKSLKAGKGQWAEVPSYKDPITDGKIQNISISYWLRTKDSSSGRVGKGRDKKVEYPRNSSNWFLSHFSTGGGWDVCVHEGDHMVAFTATFDKVAHSLTAQGDKEVKIPGYMFTATDDGKAWHHIVAAYDGSRKTIEVYVDSNRSGKSGRWNATSMNGLDKENHIIPALDELLTIGGKFTDAKQVESFDEVAIWDRVITDKEVKALYNNGYGAVIK